MIQLGNEVTIAVPVAIVIAGFELMKFIVGRATGGKQSDHDILVQLHEKATAQTELLRDIARTLRDGVRP